MSIPVRRGREVSAERGTTLRCKGWRQEAILRLLENNLENAEDPDNLVIYMSIARAARDWASFDRIVATLASMSEDQTFVVQSGKPIGVFPGQATTSGHHGQWQHCRRVEPGRRTAAASTIWVSRSCRG
jgi:urocanate hydratase